MKLSFCLVACLLLGAASTPTFATDARIDTQIRWRAENDNRAFDGTAVSSQYLRSRLGLHLDSDEKDTHVFVQIQDSRRLGDENSGSLSNDSNLGVHQAFLKVDNVFSPKLSIQVGRFEVNHGAQRLVGAVGWHNVGRSLDGVLLHGAGPRGSLQAFQLKLAEQSGVRPDIDTNLYGLYGHLVKANADGFVYYDRNDRKTKSDRVLDRWTIGAHTNRKLMEEKGDVVATVAFQTGSAGSNDISAFMIAAEVGAKPIEGKPHRVAVGVDYVTGDDDPSDDEIKAFNNMYYTGHKFRGAMDLFLGSNSGGLMDLYGKGAYFAPHAWKLQVHAHLFQTAEDFTLADNSSSSSLGAEIDFFATKKDIGRAQFDVGGSVFFPSEDWQGSDADPALWGFMSWTVNLSSDVGK